MKISGYSDKSDYSGHPQLRELYQSHAAGASHATDRLTHRRSLALGQCYRPLFLGGRSQGAAIRGDEKELVPVLSQDAVNLGISNLASDASRS